MNALISATVVKANWPLLLQNNKKSKSDCYKD